MAPSVPASRILVVEDEPQCARTIERMASHFGHQVVLAASVESALRRFAESPFDVVLTDVRLGGENGFDLMRHIQQQAPEVPVVMITGYATVDAAMEAIQAGAYDYLSKPPTLQPLGELLGRAVERKRQAQAAAEVRNRGEPAYRFDDIAGASPAMLDVFKTVARAAQGRTNVLILGESGTGKELVARALHRRSPRSERAFVPVNVSAIPEGLLETELFGHLRGAFTGATMTRRGLFEEAHQGTLFLDEIGDLSPALQAKLLRVIQEHRIKPVGSNEEIPVDVRLAVATHRDLDAMVASGLFRQDLYYRLNVISIFLPPLRERPDDIPLLLHHFLHRYAEPSGRTVPSFSPEATDSLVRYSWPGNVRELANVVERALVLCSHAVITPDALPAHILGAAEAAPTTGQLATLAETVERHVRLVLESTGGNRTQAARILGISRRTLHRMALRHRQKANRQGQDVPP